MNECTISDKVREQITARAGLVGLGLKTKQLGKLSMARSGANPPPG